MQREIMLAALRATAKLTVAATAVACVQPDSADADTLESGSSFSSLETTPTAPTKREAPRVEPATDMPDPSTRGDVSSAATCAPLLESTFADSAWDPFRTYRTGFDDPAPLPQTTDDVRACCRTEDDDVPRAHRWECCNLLGEGTSIGHATPRGCTPWGPPVPPRMPRRHDSLREAL